MLKLMSIVEAHVDRANHYAPWAVCVLQMTIVTAINVAPCAVVSAAVMVSSTVLRRTLIAVAMSALRAPTHSDAILTRIAAARTAWEVATDTERAQAA